MKVSKVFYAAMIAGLSFLASAADLTFDLKINRGAAKDYNPENKKTNIAVFVIDCSGSMKGLYDPTGKQQYYYGPDGRRSINKPWTRVQKLCDELLPKQFEALPRDTRVYAYLYNLMEIDGYIPYTVIKQVLDSDQAKKQSLRELQSKVYAWTLKTYKGSDGVVYGGSTPYFDTLALALDTIKDNWLDNRNVNLYLYNYTDGENNAWEHSYFDGKKRRKLRFLSSNKVSLKRAEDSFNRAYGKDLDRIKNDKKRLFYFEMNVGSTNDRPGFNQTQEFKVNFYRKKSALKNPKDAPSQTIPVSADFGVDLESWKFLQNQPCTLKVQFNNGPVQSHRIFIRESQKQIKVKVPDDATKVTLFFDCSDIKPNAKFKLIPPGGPEIIKFPAADPSKTGIETVTVQDRIYDGKTVLTIRKGKRVFFTAEGSAKQYTWRFFKGKSMISQKKSGDGETVDCLFNEIGDYSFEVTADGSVGPDSKKTGRINVRDIGLSISNQGDKFTLPGTWEERIEATHGDKLKPSDLNWYVIGPFTGKEKEIPEMVAVDKQRNMFKCRHFFRAPGKYEITVTASYKELPGETFTAKTSWVVSQPAKISFSKSMEGDKHNYEFGDTVKLSIDVTGEIDDKTIVWKADGNEIGRGARKLDAPAVRGKGQITVVYTVEAMDAVLKKPVEPLKITYTFGCSHTKPVLKISDRKTGKGIWGVGADVDFEVVSAEKYNQITFIFDDDPTPRPAENGHWIKEKVQGGALKYRMTCFCKKCGEKFEEEKTVTTMAKTPRPILELKEKRTRCSKGDIVTLQDNGDKEGDYVWCRLEKKNSKGEYEELDVLEKGFSKKQITLGDREFQVPQNLFPWIDFELRLVPLDGNKKVIENYQGKKVLPSELKVSVRPPLWVSLLILAIGIGFFILLIGLMKKFLFGNQPCGWTLHYMARKDLVQDNPKEKSKFADQLKVDANISIGEYWTVWTLGEKKATIPIGELMSGFAGNDDTLTIDSEGKIDYHGGFRRVANYTLPVDNSRQTSPIFEQRNKNSKQKCYLYFLLDKNELDTHYEVWFYILCFFSLAVAGAAAYWLLMC